MVTAPPIRRTFRSDPAYSRAFLVRHGAIAAAIVGFLLLFLPGSIEEDLLVYVLLVPVFAVLLVLVGALLYVALVVAFGTLALSPRGLLVRRLRSWFVVPWEEIEEIQGRRIAHRLGPAGVFEHLRIVRPREDLHLVFPAAPAPPGTWVHHVFLPRSGLYAAREEGLEVLEGLCGGTGLEVTWEPAESRAGSDRAREGSSSVPSRPPS
jgi:hypothetical protein